MHIAFVLPTFPELSETFLLRQITGLLDRGHDVRILAHRPSRRLLHHPAVAERALLERTRYLAGRLRGQDPSSDAMRSTRWRLTPRFPGAWLQAMRSDPAPSWTAPFAAMFRVGKLAGASAPDIVHCHYGEVGLQYGFAGGLWQCPLVTSFYGYDCSSFPRRLGHGIYKPLFQTSARVTVLSKAMEGRLERLGCPPSKLWIQPLSVDLTTFAPPYHPRTAVQGMRFLSIARLVEKKGLTYALEALAPLLRLHPRAEYWIAGDGPLAPELQRLASELGVPDRVKFLGPVAEPEVVRLMQEADVFLQPSVTARDGDEEGTPTVLLEAAACGLPIVATRHAGIPEVVTDGLTALLVAERDVESLRASLLRLIDDPEERLRMGKAARELVESRYGIERVSERLEELYRAVIADPARSQGIR